MKNSNLNKVKGRVSNSLRGRYNDKRFIKSIIRNDYRSFLKIVETKKRIFKEQLLKNKTVVTGLKKDLKNNLKFKDGNLNSRINNTIEKKLEKLKDVDISKLKILNQKIDLIESRIQFRKELTIALKSKSSAIDISKLAILNPKESQNLLINPKANTFKEIKTAPKASILISNEKVIKGDGSFQNKILSDKTYCGTINSSAVNSKLCDKYIGDGNGYLEVNKANLKKESILITIFKESSVEKIKVDFAQLKNKILNNRSLSKNNFFNLKLRNLKRVTVRSL